MKRTLLISLTLLVLLSSASAQQTRPSKIYVDAQGLFFTEPWFFTDFYSVGLGLGGGIEYPISPAWSVVAGIDIRTFGMDEASITEYFEDEYPSGTVQSISGGRAWGFSLSVLSKGVLRSQGDGAAPYIKGGFGLTHVTVDDAVADIEFSYGTEPRDEGIYPETNLAVTIALGLELPLGQAGNKLFFDVGYHLVMADPDNVGMVPITVGLMF